MTDPPPQQVTGRQVPNGHASVRRNQTVVCCAVCERTLLLGEAVGLFLDGAERRQVQAVVTAAGGDGLVLHALPDWRRLDLPPDTDAFAPAARGDYVLAGSGETVSDPDAIARWALSAGAVAA
jgi:hypothetical protein